MWQPGWLPLGWWRWGCLSYLSQNLQPQIREDMSACLDLTHALNFYPHPHYCTSLGPHISSQIVSNRTCPFYMRIQEKHSIRAICSLSFWALSTCNHPALSCRFSRFSFAFYSSFSSIHAVDKFLQCFFPISHTKITDQNQVCLSAPHTEFYHLVKRSFPVFPSRVHDLLFPAYLTYGDISE